MGYPQLIQFKRLEERAFIFLNGRQLMLGVFGAFGGMVLAEEAGVSGWPSWIFVILLGTTGVLAGARIRGIYGYQYLVMLTRFFWTQWTGGNRVLQPGELYDRDFDEDASFVLGAPDGGALVLRQAPPSRQVVKNGSGAGSPTIYRLQPVDLGQHPVQSIDALLGRWSQFWAGARPPLRLLVHSTPFHAGSVVEDVRAEGVRAAQDWRARGLLGYGRFLEQLTSNAAMYRADHELLVWAHSDTESDAVVNSLTSWLGVSAQAAEMTPLLKGGYEVGFDHLRPVNPRQPYIILMVSHEFSGEWSWADPLVTMLRQTFPVAVALDVERNLSSNDALKELVKYENVLLDVLRNARNRDPKAEGALQDVQLAMAKANAGLSLHFTTVVVAVHGATLAEVRRNVEAVRAMTAARLALVVLPGGQETLLKFFTPTRRRDINLPEVSHNVTSDGMAVVSGPLGFRRRSETNGIFWGIGSGGGQDTYPLFWNGFGSDPHKPAAYHGLFLGKSGYGKTVSMNALLYREALRGTQVILMEPQGHSRRLAELVGEGASYNPLSLRAMQINPLDPISDNLNEQKNYVISLIRLMLKQVDPNRAIPAREIGLLDAALSAVYDGLDDPFHTPPEYVPRLEQLCRELHRQGAATLATDLELNFVSGSLGAVYNQPTNLDMALSADAVAYDFKDIPAESRTLIYTLVLGRVQRTVRAEGRIRQRVVAIDEFGWLAQEPLLAETTAMWIKTFRTFGCGVWVAEQDLIRLTGGNITDLSGTSIISNSVFQLFFHHEPSAVRVVADTFPNVAAYGGMLETFPRPQETGLAQAILRMPDGAYHAHMLLTQIEQRYLIGS